VCVCVCVRACVESGNQFVESSAVLLEFQSQFGLLLGEGREGETENEGGREKERSQTEERKIER